MKLMRWIWIDRFTEFRSGQSARAVKNLSLAEDYFADHFPGYPVMPAALILEGIAQTGGILVGEANDFREKVVLAKILSAQFRREVVAGEQLTYDVELLHLRPEGAAVKGRVLVGAEQVAEAEIFFAHLDQARSKQLFGDHNFVFTGELKHLLGLARVQAQANRTDGTREQESGVRSQESGKTSPDS
jgi:3-hydroxyacyl-[acyl-carrier-protein] dehydratase